MQPKLAIIGSGAFAREASDVAHDLNYHLCGVFSDFEPKFNQKWLGRFEDIQRCSNDFDQLFFAIGAVDRKSVAKRQKIVDELNIQRYQLANLISPKAIVSGSVTFGKNAYIAPGSIINTDAHISDFVIINNNSTIGHDVKIGSNTVISGNVFIGGNCEIGSECIIGPGANLLQGLKIADSTVISIGATVVRSVRDTSSTIRPNINKLL